MKLIIQTQTSTVLPLNLELNEKFHSTLYWAYDYLSMLGSKLRHVSKRGSRRWSYSETNNKVIKLNWISQTTIIVLDPSRDETGICERNESLAIAADALGAFQNRIWALKISMLYKNHIFQRMGKIFCVEFQRVPLKFHTKYRTHTLKELDFIHRRKFKSS